MKTIELTKRQEQIVEIVKGDGPITGEQIAERIGLTRATLRPDLAILTMTGYLDAKPRVGYSFTGKTNSQLLTEQINKICVGDFQTIPIVILESISVYDAIVTMFLEDVGTLFVADKAGLLVGVLSRKDLLRASIGKQELTAIPVNIIMTRMPNITVCQKEDLLINAAKKLIDKQVDALPIVKETVQGLEIVGRLTKTNITKAFVALAEDESV